MRRYIICHEYGFDSIMTSADNRKITTSSHRIQWDQSFDSDATVADKEQLIDILSEGQTIETMYFYYTRSGGTVTAFSKREAFSSAAAILADNIDNLQRIYGFLPMTPAQSKQTKEYILDSLCSVRDFGSEFKCPVFACYDYTSHYNGERVRNYLCIGTGTEIWKEAINTIVKPDNIINR